MRSGGAQHPEEIMNFLANQLFSAGGVFNVAGGDLNVSQQVVPNMSVLVAIGHALLKKSGAEMAYPVRVTAAENVTIGANSSGNPRKDAIVLYIDLGASPNADISNVAKLVAVQGTPAASPVVPTDAQIVTAVGAANPYLRLANVAVANGAISILAASITDARIELVESFWKTLPATPTRVSNTQITIPDVGNVGKYDLLLSRGTVFKWTDTTVKQAVVVSATYGADVVTINIMGDILAAGFSVIKYAAEKARIIAMAIPGTLAVATDIAGHYYSPMPLKIFGADVYHGTYGTTNATTYDINKNGTTMFTTKPNIASTQSVGNGFTADDGTVAALNDYFSVDCDAISTTPPVDAYINLFVAPLNNIYLA